MFQSQLGGKLQDFRSDERNAFYSEALIEKKKQKSAYTRNEPNSPDIAGSNLGFDDPAQDFRKAIEREQKKKDAVIERRIEIQQEWDQKEEDRMKNFLSSIGKSRDEYR